ncbi:MAG: polyprenyl synthetase family protein [Deltaproteobacteria bacterium]|nr:polyprenyl synthetase family protein [Deltaproteobacteria bacterium]
MTSLAVAPATTRAPRVKETDVLGSLTKVCEAHGLGEMSRQLVSIGELVRWDMAAIEGSLSGLPLRADVVGQSAGHLVDLGGKRLRPMCVALAARLGSGFGPAAHELAVSVELVHCATLLHDDVVDMGDTRRGAPAARVVYGNAASIFAGDWLLVEALRRVASAGVPEALTLLLDIIDEMIRGEAVQLESRGRLDLPASTYFEIVEAKTAALFRWAMVAGGRAGQLSASHLNALERYGRHLGVAFQLVDDLLDYEGQDHVTGKQPFADLREGKMTYPLILALERDASLRPLLEQVVTLGADAVLEPTVGAGLLEAMQRTGAAEESRGLARERCAQAVACLDALDDSPAKDALITVAHATVHREK